MNPNYQPNQIAITEYKDGIRVPFYISTRKSRTEITGIRETAIAISLTSPAVEDRANQELVTFLAKALSTQKSLVNIVMGAHNRNKVIEITSMSQFELLTKLGLANN
ncbi:MULTISPECIES: DUF167 domain-containing protein [Acidithrix]|uniref:UPF0235 protein AXFE_09000 n=1 Tax=Acidithrix ferrooxidans TaxID=1280514 RepID=A0A0D8HJW5_9ACTN|nr:MULTISPECIES: DUF167 domain-containing protein [Acidithrix]KJF18250.1 hypothetical protein AXFE_09000 [Acidithrix ferrooxidans]